MLSQQQRIMGDRPWALVRKSTNNNGDGTDYMPDLNISLPRNSKPVHIHCLAFSFNIPVQ